MRYTTGNILDYIGRAGAICITTNGFTKSNGEAVMGRGIAKQMADRYPYLPKLLGNAIRDNGNIIQELGVITKTKIISFPVKPISIRASANLSNEVVSHAVKQYKAGDMVPGFHCKADVNIITESIMDLVALTKAKPIYVVLPILGCGAGELSFNKDGIREKMESNLNDFFYCMSFNKVDFTK